MIHIDWWNFLVLKAEFFCVCVFSKGMLAYLCHSWCICQVPHQYTSGKCGDKAGTAPPHRIDRSGSG